MPGCIWSATYKAVQDHVSGLTKDARRVRLPVMQQGVNRTFEWRTFQVECSTEFGASATASTANAVYEGSPRPESSSETHKSFEPRARR